jgi:hypothetical protein
MKMKTGLILLICHICFCLKAASQYYYYNSRFYESNLVWTAGLSAGGMNCLTDIGGGQTGRKSLADANWVNTLPAFGCYASAWYNRQFALRGEITWGNVKASDQVLKSRKGAQSRWRRNLDFQTELTEFILLIETYPVKLLWPASDDHSLSPYLLSGIGYYFFDPLTKDGGRIIRLAPLHTEGQGFKEYPDRSAYQLHQWNLCLGTGLRWELSGLIHLALELVYRKLFTDYLDDVSKTYVDPGSFNNNLPPVTAAMGRKMADRSYRPNAYQNNMGETRGNPGNKDAYFSVNMKAALVLGRERRTW